MKYILICLTMASCALGRTNNALTIAYNKVIVNDSSYQQINIVTFNKGCITRSDENFNVISMDYIWDGDSVRYRHYSMYREHTFKMDTTRNCLILTGKETVTKYCKNGD